MKKKIIGVIATTALAITAGWAYQQNENTLVSDLTLENIEALANGESGSLYKYSYPGSDPSVKCVCGGSGSVSCC